MTTLMVFRGLPGSGKTTAGDNIARTLGYTRISRDDLRRNLFDKHGGETSVAEEQEVTRVQRKLVTDLLCNGFGVIVDDTVLPNRYAREWLTLAQQVGAEIVWHDLRHVPLDVCLARNAQRSNPVPEDWIRDRWERYCRNPTPNPTEPLGRFTAADEQSIAPYVPDLSLPPAFLCDVDGTLAHNLGYRDPYDIALAGYDVVDPVVGRVLDGLYERCHRIVITTAREDTHREVTEQWLGEWAKVLYDDLFMRAAGDRRPDWQVKREMLDKIGTQYNVLGVFDDRPSVCRAWRAAGLKVFQVGDPHIEF